MIDNATTTAAPAKKTAGKKTTAKKGGKKKAAKKVAKKAAKGGMGDARDTIRLRMFKLLKKNPNGLTGADIRDKLDLSGVPNILRDEGINANPPRIRRLDIEGKSGVVYQLTAAGLKALADGTVNSDAPESANGMEWPSGR